MLPQTKAFVLALILSAIALCCNPVGPRLLLYPFNMLFQQPTNINAVQEWLPPDPASERGIAMLACMFAVLAIPLCAAPSCGCAMSCLLRRHSGWPSSIFGCCSCLEL